MNDIVWRGTGIFTYTICIIRDGDMIFLDLGASEYWSRVGSVSGRYPEPPLLIRRALDEDTLPVRDAHGLLGNRMFTRFTCFVNFYSVPCQLGEFYCTAGQGWCNRGRDASVAGDGLLCLVLKWHRMLWQNGPYRGDWLQLGEPVPLLHCSWSLLPGLRWGINL